MAVMITTTVSLQVDEMVPKKVIHLVKGDTGTRRLRLIPILEGGQLLDMGAAGVKSADLLLSDGANNLLIHCELGDHYADFVPTANMMGQATVWQAQLALMNIQNETVTTVPFVIYVHGNVWSGDAVEHTDVRVSKAEWMTDGRLKLTLMNGETVITATKWEHTHDLAVAPDAQQGIDGSDGFMSREDKAAITTLANRLNAFDSGTADVHFETLTIGETPNQIVISDGTITGAVFG